jgi:mono/diheme cytochrome c family protein
VKPFFIGMLIGWIVLPLAALLYLRFGYVPVAVNGPVIPFEELLAGTAVQARIARDAPTKAALPPSEENLVAGAKIYREQCIECHGLPGAAASSISKGMYPPPPQFFERKVMGNDPVGQNYWIVANGIRLTGMPGYKGALSDQQLWQVSQFLSNRGSLSATANEVLGSPASR